jgi:heme-degrading monooxygenase HmoA
MITHIVAWKLKAEDADGRAAGVAAIAGALEPLVGVIDGLLDLKVSANAAAIEGNSDAGLIAHFETEADLRAYLVHPEHVKAVHVVRENTAGRAAIDFEA